MKKGLIIVESPSKAKTISKFLNNQYEILSSVGHIRDLPKKKLGVDVENDFKPKYVNDRSKSKIIKQLKAKAKELPEIFLASDHDREGEAIAWHLTQVLKKEIKDKKVHRIVFNEITKSSIVKAMKNPGKIDQDKVDAQQARRILDRVVGYTLSPVLWKVIAKNLSAGRVQSVALRLICEREAEIKKFIPKEYWSITNTFKKQDALPFDAALVKFKNKKLNLNNKKETDEILEYLKNKEFQI
ncbi:MAG: toprim domain-containing protein, partial [Candidatus Cloacimonadota bacterium]|nr:toprim domain-containing protein [Candidatus Cloacimonadota bacterium]